MNVSSRRKIWQRLPELESLREKKGIVSCEDLLTINGTKQSTHQEAARAAHLSKSKDFTNEVSDDATSVINLTEEEHQEHIYERETNK
ncbi:hypothetical protein TNCV_127421 [Trichonephila clavipes]|nr:hypothetical protein TNCV_127421 [Trichonephila clavipes]